jgi:hypothetical protein
MCSDPRPFPVQFAHIRGQFFMIRDFSSLSFFTQVGSTGGVDCLEVQCSRLWTVVLPFAKNKQASFEYPENGRQLYATYLSKFTSLRKNKELQNRRSTGSVPSWISHHMSFRLNRRQNPVMSRLQRLLDGALGSRKSSRCSTEVLWSHAIYTYIPAVTCNMTLSPSPDM